MLHLCSVLYHVLMNSVNFGREVKSLMSSSEEFQILSPSVFRLFSPNVVVFTLLMNKSFFLLAECDPCLKNVCMNLDLRILKS